MSVVIMVIGRVHNHKYKEKFVILQSIGIMETYPKNMPVTEDNCQFFFWKIGNSILYSLRTFKTKNHKFPKSICDLI